MVTSTSEVMEIKRRPRSGSLPFIITPATERITPTLPFLATAQKRKRRITISDSEDSCSKSGLRVHAAKPKLSKSLEHLPSLVPNGMKNRDRQYIRQVHFDSEEDPNNLGLNYYYKHLSPNIDNIPESRSSTPNHHNDVKGILHTQTSVPSCQDDQFHLPPLPSGSLTFQSVMKDFYFYNPDNSNSSSDESSGEDITSDRLQHRRTTRKPRWAWYGPIVEYKGHHIFLSTLNSLQVTIGRYGCRKWCH